MAWNDVKIMKGPELERQLGTLREQLRDARFRVSQGQLKDVRQVRSLKKDIARMLTRLKQLESQPAKPVKA